MTNNDGKRETVFQTAASNGQKWAVSWTDANVVVLYSSDVGTHAYDVGNESIIERIANAAEEKAALAAYEKKYGKSPGI